MIIIVWLYKGDDKNEKRHKFLFVAFLYLLNFTIYSIMSCIHNTIYSSMQNIIENIKE